MPIYEYACAACGHQFEEWQKITDTPVKVCPKCKAKKVERLISQTSFHLKGGGWYSDLYSGPQAERRRRAGRVQGLDHQRNEDRLHLDHQVEQRQKVRGRLNRPGLDDSLRQPNARRENT